MKQNSKSKKTKQREGGLMVEEVTLPRRLAVK
jgi:hypothetical protein